MEKTMRAALAHVGKLGLFTCGQMLGGGVTPGAQSRRGARGGGDHCHTFHHFRTCSVYSLMSERSNPVHDCATVRYAGSSALSAAVRPCPAGDGLHDLELPSRVTRSRAGRRRRAPNRNTRFSESSPAPNLAPASPNFGAIFSKIAFAQMSEKKSRNPRSGQPSRPEARWTRFSFRLVQVRESSDFRKTR